jgi:acetyltransferase-like isoleucine patch superfamily enzyme
VVLYGIGSSLVVDAEEACARAGVDIVAGVRNVDGEVFTGPAVRIVAPAGLTAAERECAFVVALFTPGHRAVAVTHARGNGFATGAVLVDPTAPVARSTTLAEGVFVNAGAVIAAQCRLDEWALVNRSASIGHHGHVGPFASIGPGAVLCAFVTLGRGAVIGAGSVVLPQISVGAHAVVSAGSVVKDDVPARAMVEGNPARVVRTGIVGYKGLAA